MVFNSFSFLFAYLPIVLILFWVSRRYLGRQWADVCLIVASLVFYGWNYPKCLPVLLGSLIVNYAWGLFSVQGSDEEAEGSKGKGSRKKRRKDRSKDRRKKRFGAG